MKIPVLRGTIDRRMLVNFRADPEVVQAILPDPFRPKLVRDHAMVGICLIRLKNIRPRFVPGFMGLSSENAAHRIAVTWEDRRGSHEGVFVARRDSSSRLNSWAGGKLFPGVQHHSVFRVSEADDRFALDMESDDKATRIHIRAAIGEGWPSTSIFRDLQDASRFFEGGSVGYSPAAEPGTYQGMELRTSGWTVESLDTESVASTFFENAARFPKGSIAFDCALVMRGLPHEWHSRPDLVGAAASPQDCCGASSRAPRS
jgi:hypothetical protein